MDSFIARQPVFDAEMNVYAYELLYRSDVVKNSFDLQTNLDHASAKVILDSFHGIGLERITGGKKAFVNFTDHLLEEDAATLFPSQTLVVEVLETVSPTPRLLETLEKLRALGYQIALDDYEYTAATHPMLALADIVKIDFMALDESGIRQTISHIDTRRTRLLAEKVETRQEYELAKSLGFTFFQGYFFAMPDIRANRVIEPVKMNYLRLTRQVWGGGPLDYPELARTIRQDMAMSYKMLKLVNSAHYATRREIKDIRQALVLLGEADIRKWVSLIALAGYGRGRPDELMRMSLVRARFMEGYAASHGLPAGEGEALFLSGLFSLIDVMLERPMDELLTELSLPDEVEQALLCGDGVASHLLELMRGCEGGDWDAAALLNAELPPPPLDLSALYLAAIDWCNAILAA